MTEIEMYQKALSALKCPESTAKSQNTLTSIREIKSEMRQKLFGIGLGKMSVAELDFFEKGTPGQLISTNGSDLNRSPLYYLYAQMWWAKELISLQNQPYSAVVTNANPFNPMAYDMHIRTANVYCKNVVSKLQRWSDGAVTHRFVAENIGGAFTVMLNENSNPTILKIGEKIKIRTFEQENFTESEIISVSNNGTEFTVADSFVDEKYICEFLIDLSKIAKFWPLIW